MNLPRFVHRVWLTDPMPDAFRRFGDQWAELNPDWELFDWANLAALPEMRGTSRDLINRAAEWYPRDAKRFAADIVRLELLWTYGGVYVDCDVEPLRTLDGLIDQLAIDVMAQVAVAGRSPQSIGGVHPITNAVMAATPRHPWIGVLLDGLPDAVARYHHRTLAQSVGPWHLHRTYARDEWPTVLILPPDVLYGPDSGLRHHWNNARRRAGVGLDQ